MTLSRVATLRWHMGVNALLSESITSVESGYMYISNGALSMLWSQGRFSSYVRFSSSLRGMKYAMAAMDSISHRMCEVVFFELKFMIWIEFNTRDVSVLLR